MSELVAKVTVDDNTKEGLKSVSNGLKGVQKSAEEAGNGFASMDEKSEGALGKLKESLKGVATVAAGMVAGSALMGMTSSLEEQFKDVIGQTTAWGEEVRVLSQNMGVSAEDASTLALAMKDLNIQPEVGEKAFLKFAKGLNGVEDDLEGALTGSKSTLKSLQELGVATEDATGKQRPFMNTLGDVADKFKDMPDGMAKSQIAMSLFGKTGAEMIPMLNLGKEGLAEVSTEAKKYGLQLTSQNVGDIRKFALAHNEMNAAVEGARLQIGMVFIPILTKLTGMLTEGIVHAREWFQAFSESSVFQTVKGVLETVVGALGQVKDMFGGFIAMFSGADEDGQAFAESLDAIFGPGNPIADGIGQFAGMLMGLRDAFGKVVDMIKALAAGDANSFFLALTEGASGLGLNVGALRGIFLNLTSFLFGDVPAAFDAVKAKFNEVHEAVQPAIDAITGFVSMKDVLLAVGIVIGTSLVSAFIAWGVAAAGAAISTMIALAPIIIPIAAIAAAIALLRAAWSNNWGDIQGKVQAVWDFLQPIFAGIGDALAKFWIEIQPKLAMAWDAISTKIADVLHFIWNDILQPGVALLVSFWQTNWDSISKVLTGIWDGIKLYIDTVWTIIQGVIKVGLDLLSGNWQTAWDDIKATVSHVLDNVVTLLTTILPNITSGAIGIAGALKDGLVGALGDLGGKLTSALSGVINGIHIDIGPFHLSAAGFTIDAPPNPFAGMNFGLNMGVVDSSGGGGGGGTGLPFGPAGNPEHKPFETAGGQPTDSPSNGGVANTPTGFGPRFASGGSFVVGGASGTDTNLVSFMATRGERVTITPEQTSGLSSLQRLVSSLVGLPSLAPAPGASGLAGRPLIVQVDVAGSVMAEDDLAQTIRNALIRLGRDTTGLGFV